MASRDVLELAAEGDAAGAVILGIVGRLRTLNNAAPFEMQPNAGDFVNVGVRTPEVRTSGVQVTVDFALTSDAARTRIRQAVDAAVAAARTAHPDTRLRVTYTPRWIPGVHNDAAIARRAITSVRAELGQAAVLEDPGVMPAFSEDFGHMLDVVPGTMLFLGVSNASRGWVGMPHTPGYVADDAAIAVGARALTRVLLDEMTRAP